MAIQIINKKFFLFLGLLFAVVGIIAVPRTSHAFTITKVGNTLGLVGWWTFDGKDMLSNVMDVSGSGNNGTLSGFTSTTTAAGKLGQGLRFDGTNDSVDITFPTATAYTISMWVKLDSISAQNFIVRTDVNGPNSTYSHQLRINFAGQFQHYTYYGGVSTITGSTVAEAGKWYHIVAVSENGGTSRLYVNGQEEGTPDSGVTTLWTAGTKYMIGTSAASTYGFFRGIADDVRIYHRVLSAKEIAALYNTGAGTKQSSAIKSTGTNGLIGYWTFDGKDMFPNIVDVTGRGNAGRLSGSTATTTVIGKNGQALKLNGVNQYVTLTQASGLPIYSTTSPYSISLWFNGGYNGMFYGEGGNNDAFFGIGIQNIETGTGRVRTVFRCNGYVGLDGQTSAFTLTPGENKWHNIVWTDNGGTAKMYIDGIEDPAYGSVSWNHGVCNTTLPNSYLGVLPDSFGPAYFYPGALDEVRVYNKALTPSEAGQVYSQGIGTKMSTGNSLLSGLVGYWTFDGKKMLQNIGDSSGAGNNGKLSGQSATTTTIGKIGQGLRFDGVNDYVTVTDDSSLRAFADFGYSVWFKLEGYGDPYETVFSKGVNGEEYKVLLYAPDQSNGAIQCWANSTVPTGGGATISGGLKLNKWYHFVCTRNGSALKIYLNGEEIASGTYSTQITSGSNNLIIGNTAANIYPVNGTIDDLRIYSRGLSVEEVKTLYNMGQ
jgi:hypothetical protein